MKTNHPDYAKFINDIVNDMIMLQAEAYPKIQESDQRHFAEYVENSTTAMLITICHRAAQCCHHADNKINIKEFRERYLRQIAELALMMMQDIDDDAAEDFDLTTH